MSKHARISWIITFSLICSLVSAVLFCPIDSLADDSQTLVVGYVQNYGTIQTPTIKGSEGYGYEYLNTVLEYTEGDYELEFVACTWEEGEAMLRTGEIDLLGPSAYTDERAEEFLYTTHDFGTSYLFLSTIDSAADFFDDIDDLNGSTIGAHYSNAHMELLQSFLDDNILDAEIVIYNNTDYDGTPDSYDYYLTTSMVTVDGMTALKNLGSYPVYYMFSADNQAVVEDFDQALTAIETEEYLYQERLYLKYFDTEINFNSYVTLDDLALLQDQDVYRVGITDLASPIAQLDDNGDFTGIAVDVLDLIADAGGFTVEYVDLSVSSDTDVDFSILALDDESRLHATESDTYCEISLLLIDKASDDAISTIGTMDYYNVQESLYGRTIITYDNLQELRMGFDNGEIDSMIISTVSYNLLRDQIQTDNYLSTPLNSNLSLNFTFADDFPDEKVDIFNKLIANLDDAEVESIVFNHATVLVSESYPFQFFEENPWFLFILAIFTMTIFLLFECQRRSGLARIVNYDKLTGLYSQHKFEEEAHALLYLHPGRSYSLLSLDIDNFKYINELYGYEVGSNLLCKLANFLQQETDPQEHGSLLARGYADTFLIFAETAAVQARMTALTADDSALRSILNQDISESYEFSFSLGVYHVTNKALGLSYMIDCCNIARGLGKNTVGTTVHQFTSHMEQQRASNNEIITNMEQALQNQEYFLQYQPKVDLTTERITGAEALVRWQRSDNLVPPGDFIELFEKNGFILKLDYYVLEHVCQFIKSQEGGDLPRISVNLSSVTIMQEDVIDHIMAVLARTGVEPHALDLEITETAFVQQFERATSRIDALRLLGFTISMDDFGAGISSLNRLQGISFDILKIDRQFIINSINSVKGSAIIESIVAMAKKLNLEIVAEGIETREQCEFLKKLGCDVGQGYYYSRPVSQQEFLNLLHK